jgi:phage-related protein
VNFRCYPFWYKDNVSDVTISTSGGTITNPGSVYSEPLITLTGSGDITLMVGTTIVELADITTGIVLDCALKEAYLGTTLMNDHMSGDFPVLKPGLNAISWFGNVTSVVISPRWRFL